MREGPKRQEQEAPPPPLPGSSRRGLGSGRAGRGTQLARLCLGAGFCWLAFGDYPSQADDFEHELAAARLIENSVLTSHLRGAKPERVDAEDLERVAHIFQRLVARHPKNAGAHAAYASYLWDIHDEAAAMAQWQTAWTLDSHNAMTASHLGACYLESGDARSAIDYFGKAAALDSKNAVCHFELANAVFLFRHDLPGGSGAGEQGVLRRALAEFRKASELDPFNAEYARAYAETFYGLKDPDWREALEAWTHFLELKGPPDFCYTNMARVNLKLGRKADALQNLEQVRRADFFRVKEHLMKEAAKP